MHFAAQSCANADLNWKFTHPLARSLSHSLSFSHTYIQSTNMKLFSTDIQKYPKTIQHSDLQKCEVLDYFVSEPI